MTCTGLCTHGADLDLAGRQSGDRHLVGFEAFLQELLVQRDVGVAHDGREDEVGLGLTDLVEHGCEFRAAEGHVVLADDFATGAFEPDLGVLVGLLGPDVVGADKIDLLAKVLDHEGNEVLRVLVGKRAGVDDVLRALAAFIAGRVVEQVVAGHDDRGHGAAAGRRIAAKGGDHAVAQDQLADLFRVDLDVRLGVDDDWLDLHAGYAAIGVDFVDGVLDDLGGVVLDHCQRAGLREEDADLDGPALGDPRLCPRGARPDDRRSCERHGCGAGALDESSPGNLHLFPPAVIVKTGLLLSLFLRRVWAIATDASFGSMSITIYAQMTRNILIHIMPNRSMSNLNVAWNGI